MLAKHDATEEERREAARAMGRAKTPAKAAAARANGFKAGDPRTKSGGRSPVALDSIPCDCEAGSSLEGHRWNCPRGQAIKRRIKENRDIQTGVKLDTVVAQ